MTRRTRSKQVVFCRPFLLSGLSTLQPAGTYIVDTEEELPGECTNPTTKQATTVIRITRGTTTEYLSIQPFELHEALMRDGAQAELSVLSSTSHRSRHRRARETMNPSRTRNVRR